MENLQTEPSTDYQEAVTVEDLTAGAIALLFEYPDMELDQAVTIDQGGLSCT